MTLTNRYYLKISNKTLFKHIDNFKTILMVTNVIKHIKIKNPYNILTNEVNNP